jgi:hypothetical protein
MRTTCNLQLDYGGLTYLEKKFTISKRRIGQICEEYTLQVKDTLHPDLKPMKNNSKTVEHCTVDGELVRQAKRMFDNYQVDG